VTAHAVAAGMSGRRASDVMIAVHELAANAVRHGAGSGRLRLEHAAGVLRCQVDDPAAAARPDRGRDRRGHLAAAPWPFVRGQGLWLVRRVAAQISASPGPAGTRITAVFTIARA